MPRHISNRVLHLHFGSTRVIPLCTRSCVCLPAVEREKQSYCPQGEVRKCDTDLLSFFIFHRPSLLNPKQSRIQGPTLSTTTGFRQQQRQATRASNNIVISNNSSSILINRINPLPSTMSEQQQQQGEQKKGGIPWLIPETQQLVEWRDGDIVVAVPAKSGTTWTMNIVHQLRSGGDGDFKDIYCEVMWMEFANKPGVTPEILAQRIAEMPTTRRRAFKSHAGPGVLPFVEAGSGKDVKYVVVIRNPEDALTSFRPFIASHKQEWFDLWGLPKEAFMRPSLEAFYNEIIVPQSMWMMVFGFAAAWWPKRHEKNVLFLHYTDMVKDHEGSIRKIADFLDMHPTAEQWPNILKYTSFEWMKAHEERFELPVYAPNILESGAMVRRGQVGKAREEGFTEAMSADLLARGSQIIQDKDALHWIYHGGALP